MNSHSSGFHKFFPLVLFLASCSDQAVRDTDGPSIRPGSPFPSTVRVVSIQRGADTSSGEITGYVFDRDSGNRLDGANVVLSGTQMGASTDVAGYFRIIGVQPRMCRIVSSYVGAKKGILDSLFVGQHDIITLEIQLAADSVWIW